MFDGGVNPFAKFVTGMIVEKRQECLAEYLSLVPHAAEFVNHVEEIHTQEGFTSDGTGLTERDLAKHGGYLEELKDFRKAALESASVIAAPVSSSDDISKYFNITPSSAWPSHHPQPPTLQQLTKSWLFGSEFIFFLTLMFSLAY